jgi:hypothetical protein
MSQRAEKLIDQSRATYQNFVFGQTRIAVVTATHPMTAPCSDARMHLAHRPNLAKSVARREMNNAFTERWPAATSGCNIHLI